MADCPPEVALPEAADYLSCQPNPTPIIHLVPDGGSFIKISHYVFVIPWTGLTPDGHGLCLHDAHKQSWPLTPRATSRTSQKVGRGLYLHNAHKQLRPLHEQHQEEATKVSRSLYLQNADKQLRPLHKQHQEEATGGDTCVLNHQAREGGAQSRACVNPRTQGRSKHDDEY